MPNQIILLKKITKNGLFKHQLGWYLHKSYPVYKLTTRPHDSSFQQVRIWLINTTYSGELRSGIPISVYVIIILKGSLKLYLSRAYTHAAYHSYNSKATIAQQYLTVFFTRSVLCMSGKHIHMACGRCGQQFANLRAASRYIIDQADTHGSSKLCCAISLLTLQEQNCSRDFLFQSWYKLIVCVVNFVQLQCIVCFCRQ